MIQEAYILGNIGVAVCKQKNNWFTINHQTPDVQKELHSFDLNSLLLSNSEVLSLKENPSLDTVKDSLQLATDCQEGLTTALQLMDLSIKKESTKVLIAEYLEELLENEVIYKFVQSRLWGTPTPPDFSPSLAFEIATKANCDITSALFSAFAEQQDLVAKFVVCWDKVNANENYFKNSDAVVRAYNKLVDKDYIKTFIQSIYDGNQSLWDNVAINASLNLGFKNALLFSKVLKELRRTYDIEFTRKARVAKKSTTTNRDEIAEVIYDYLEGLNQEKKSKRRNKKDTSRRGAKRRKRNNNFSYKGTVLSSVEYRFEEILDHLRKKDKRGANHYLKELIKYQITTSSPEQICKTLCSLSTTIQQIDLKFAKKIIEYEYKRIKERFPDNVVALTGYAEVLKGEGDLRGAKREYERIKERFPDNEIVKHALAVIYFQEKNYKKLETVLPIVEKPKSSQDYYWFHLNILFLIKKGEWQVAKKRLVHGYKNCNFYKHKKTYKRTLKYVNIQIKEFDELFSDIAETTTEEPVDHLIHTHAYAITNQKELALASLNVCKKYKQISIIYDTACLLSERFSINGLPKKNLPHSTLDKMIQEQELDALITII